MNSLDVDALHHEKIRKSRRMVHSTMVPTTRLGKSLELEKPMFDLKYPRDRTGYVETVDHRLFSTAPQMGNTFMDSPMDYSADFFKHSSSMVNPCKQHYFKKQFGRHNVATMPPFLMGRRHRPTGEHTAVRSTTREIVLHNEMGGKARGVDPRLRTTLPPILSPLNTLAPGVGRFQV